MSVYKSQSTSFMDFSAHTQRNIILAEGPQKTAAGRLVETLSGKPDKSQAAFKTLFLGFFGFFRLILIFFFSRLPHNKPRASSGKNAQQIIQRNRRFFSFQPV